MNSKKKDDWIVQGEFPCGGCCYPIALCNALAWYGLPHPRPGTDAWERLVDVASCRHGSTIGRSAVADHLGLVCIDDAGELSSARIPFVAEIDDPVLGRHAILVVGLDDGGRIKVVNYKGEGAQWIEVSDLLFASAHVQWVRVRRAAAPDAGNVLAKLRRAPKAGEWCILEGTFCDGDWHPGDSPVEFHPNRVAALGYALTRRTPTWIAECVRASDSDGTAIGWTHGPAELAEAAPHPGREAALRFIADQPCRHEAEGSGEGFPCSETEACVTEWCHPCYAKAALLTKGENDDGK